MTTSVSRYMVISDRNQLISRVETPCILSRIFFGTDPVFRWEGPFTLLRRVSLNMIPKGMMIRRPLSENFCDLDFAILLMSISGFPSLDYLDLDFNSLICTEPDRLMVRAIKKLQYSEGANC